MVLWFLNTVIEFKYHAWTRNLVDLGKAGLHLYISCFWEAIEAGLREYEFEGYTAKKNAVVSKVF